MVKLFTTKKNRFNNSLLVSNKTIHVDSKGYVEVDESMVVHLLKVGFELDDPTVKFESEEEQKKVEEMNGILESARSQAKEIITQAQIEAEKIIEDARKKAGLILQDNMVEEKEEARKNLEEKSVKEIKEILAASDVDEAQYKNLKKDELIDLAISISFGKE